MKLISFFSLLLLKELVYFDDCRKLRFFMEKLRGKFFINIVYFLGKRILFASYG